MDSGVPAHVLNEAQQELREAKAAWKAAEGQGKLQAAVGVAEAKVGVAKAELGVAKAEWQAAPEGEEREKRWKLVETANAVLLTANTAYEEAIKAAAATPGGGGVAAGAAGAAGGTGKTDKESGHESVSSDLESAFEVKAGQKMKIVLWGMFKEFAFADISSEYESNRTIGKFEFDFVSHLHVHDGLAVLQEPGEDFAFVNGTTTAWFEALKSEWQSRHQSASGGEDEDNKAQKLTPTKPSTETDSPTHYVVCETKVTNGKKALGLRLKQLEERMEVLCKRANVTDVTSIIALAGIGAPRFARITCNSVKTHLDNNQKEFPLLFSLCAKFRVFVLWVETAGDRIERLERGQLEMQEEQRKAQEEQRKAQEEQRKAQEEQQKEQRKMLEDMQQQIAALSSKL